MPRITKPVFYHPSALELQTQNITQLDPLAPFAATIVYVAADGTVNLSVSDHDGHPMLRQSVPYFASTTPPAMDEAAYAYDIPA